MLKIRLARSGAKKKPFFHITVADSRMPRDGRFIERVGYFNPISRGKEVRLEVNQERIDYWVSQGAQLSERVLTLIEESKETPEEKKSETITNIVVIKLKNAANIEREIVVTYTQ